MKISSKAKYAVKIVEFLSDKETVKANVIIEHLDVSAPYFEQICSILVRNGIVSTKRGCRGGFSLCKGVETKTMWDLIQAFNGDSWDENGSLLDTLRDKFIAAAQETKLIEA